MFVDSITPLLKEDAIMPKNGTITFSFASGLNQISAQTQDAVRYIFKNAIEPFINVNFVEIDSEADINFQLHNDSRYYAYAQNHDVFISRWEDNDYSDSGFQSGFGSQGFETLIHETLHALGLSHPGNYNGDGPEESGPFLEYSLDNTTNSVMTYNSAGKSAITAMPYDIAALQSIYGERALNTGNTTYKFSSVYSFSDGTRTWGDKEEASKLTLMDEGGTDTLDFSGLAYNNSGYVLDLGLNGILTTSDAYNASSYQPRDYNNSNTGEEYTSTYGTRLDFDTKIESVIGSSSSDTIYAGLYAYEVNGSSGDDWIEGSYFEDDLYGGYGSDVLLGNAGDDLLFGGVGDLSGYSYSDYYGNDYLYGESGNDSLYGENGDDLLSGGSGNDWLEGTSNVFSSDRDELWGGSGQDYFVLGQGQNVFYQGSGYATIKDWTGGVDKIAIGGSAENYSVYSGNISGGSATDTGIYYNNDLIGVLEDTTDLYSVDYVFV